MIEFLDSHAHIFCKEYGEDSDLIILLENGNIAEQGNHEELMKLNGKYASMYRLQTMGEG